MLASTFVLLGGAAMVVWIWPENRINTFAEVFEVFVAILGLSTSVIVVWSLWMKKDG